MPSAVSSSRIASYTPRQFLGTEHKTEGREETSGQELWCCELWLPQYFIVSSIRIEHYEEVRGLSYQEEERNWAVQINRASPSG